MHKLLHKGLSYLSYRTFSIPNGLLPVAVNFTKTLVFLTKAPIIEAMEWIKTIATTRTSYLKGLLLLSVGVLFLGWLLNTPAGLLGKADAVGYAVCHRIDVRSFHMGLRQLPLCARCSGMYLGVMLGLAYQAVIARRRGALPRWPVWVVLGLFVLAFGIDGVNSYLHLFPGAPSLYEPQNWLRLLTGTGMGLAMAAMIFPAFNQTAWVDWQDIPALNGRSFPVLVGLALLLDLLVLTENPLLLYPLALTSAATVLLILTMVYTMVWVIVLRWENKFLTLYQLILPLVGGFGLALLQIVLLDVARYALTGTWDGFHLG